MHESPRSRVDRLSALDDRANDVGSKPADPDEPFKVPPAVAGNERMGFAGERRRLRGMRLCNEPEQDRVRIARSASSGGRTMRSS
jgi:hypothetical protein